MDGTAQEMKFCVHPCLETATLNHLSKLRTRLFQLKVMLLLLFQKHLTPKALAQPTAQRILWRLYPLASHTSEHPARNRRDKLGQDLSFM